MNFVVCMLCMFGLYNIYDCIIVAQLTVVQQLVYVRMVSKSIPLQSKTIKLIGELQYIM